MLVLVDRKSGWQTITVSLEHSVRVIMSNVVIIRPNISVKRNGGKRIMVIKILVFYVI